MELQETSTQPAASSFTSLSPPPDRPAVASTTTTTSFYAPGPASSSLPPSPSTSTTTTTTATKKDAFVRLSPNQAHDTVIIKDEDDTENSFVMNQLAPLPTTSSTLTSPTPPRLPSFHFPPLASTAAPGPAAPPPLPLTALAPSLFTSTSSSSSSSSSSSTSSSPSSSPMLSPFLTPTTTSPSPPHMAAGSASSSTPVAAPLSQQQQQAMLTAAQQIARLNSLTQMTSQIAAIALDAEAAKAAWVADMSRSLQTELQSVYLHLHSGGAETAVPPPQSSFSSSSTSPPPSLSFTPGTSPSAPPLLPTPQKLQLSSSPTHSPLQAAAAATLPPPPPGFPGHGHGRHLPVQPAAAIMPVLAPTTPSTPASDVAEDKKTGGRRRRKPKTKDSFNHMQRKCASCQRTETTKWRHGPLGSNTLCNTCGLAYSRKKKREAEQAAKQLQQGGNPQAVMPPTPATSASPPTP